MPSKTRNFDDYYTKGLKLRNSGDHEGLAQLIDRAYKAGLPSDDLAKLGNMMEGALRNLRLPQ